MEKIFDAKNERKLIQVLFWGSLCIRIVYVVFFNVNRVADGQDILLLTRDDQQSYWLFAKAMLSDSSWLTEDVSYRPPLYPLFLSVVTILFGTGEHFMNIFLVQSVVSSFSVVIIYYLAKTIFNRQTAFFSSLWAGIYPLFLYYSGFMLGETLVIAFFLFFTLSLLLYIKERRESIVVFSGIIYALMIHTDPRFIVHLPFIFVYFYIGLRDVKQSAKAYLILFLVMLGCSLPWAIRNHAVYPDQFVFINTRTSDKWVKRPLHNIHRHSDEAQGQQVRAKPDTLEEFEALKRRNITVYKNRTRDDGSDETIDTPRFAKIYSDDEITAFEHGARPQFSIHQLYIYHFVEFWRFARFRPAYNPYPDLRFENVWAPHRNIIGILFTGVLIPFFLAGIIFCMKQKNNYQVILCLIVFVHTLLHVFVHSRERYRMPIEGLMFMIAFYGLFEIVTRFKIRAKATGV
jgi:4-amino-4-deoxy-L-arabinose transferase-like glycosyltransferase